MKKYTRYIKPYLFFFIVGPIMMLTEVFGEVWIPRLMSMIINNGVANHDIGYILKIGCIMLGASEGLHRDMTVYASGAPIRVPVGEAVLGRLFDALGNTIDGEEPIPDDVPHEKRTVGRGPVPRRHTVPECGSPRVAALR